MDWCRQTQLAVVSLAPSAFQKHPEFADHIGKCDDCRQFVQDIKEFRGAPTPSWFLNHVPRNFWQDLEEEIKATVYRGKKSQTVAFLKQATLFLIGCWFGVLILAHLPSILPRPQNEILAHFEWDRFFGKIDQLTNFTKVSPPTLRTQIPLATEMFLTADLEGLNRTMVSPSIEMPTKEGERHATQLFWSP